MTIINIPKSKIFAQNASTIQCIEYGSNNTPVNFADPNWVNNSINTNWSQGLEASITVLGNQAQPRADHENMSRAVFSGMYKYLVQQSSPTLAYSPDIEYNINAYTHDTVTGKVYRSKSAPNEGNALSNTIFWEDTGKKVSNFLNHNPDYNYIINGDFNVWQRGLSFSLNPVDTRYICDRFLSTKSGVGGTCVISRKLLNAGELEGIGQYVQYALNINQSVAQTSQTISDISQPIEDVRTLAGQTCTLTFWVNFTSIQSIGCYLVQNFGTGGSGNVTTATQTFTIPANQWTKVTATFTLPTINGKVIGNNSALYVHWDLPKNVTFNMSLALCQLQIGDFVKPFAYRPLTLELSLCYRYFELIPIVTQVSALFQFPNYSWKSQKRIPPVLSVYSGLLNGATVAPSGISSGDPYANVLGFRQNSGATNASDAVIAGDAEF